MCRTRNYFPCANELLRMIRLMYGHCGGFAIIAKVILGYRTCVGRLKTDAPTSRVRCFEVIRDTRQPNTRLQSG